MASQFSLEPGWRVALAHLEEKERGLSQVCRTDEERYSGLVDLESRLGLVQTRLGICLVLMDAMAATSDRAARRKLELMASRRARDAVGELDELRSMNVSEDQRILITDNPEYAEAVRLLEQLILEGGGQLLERAPRERRRDKTVRDALVRAIAKCAESGESPPGGIGEEEEGITVSERMRMPLSQAILYVRSELLPELTRQLQGNPGDPAIQLRIEGLRRQIEQLRRLRFVPRSAPVLLEKGFATDWMSAFTAEGELLVNVTLPVTYRTGTNVSRMQSVAISELVHLLAGRGVCRRLDEGYEELRGIESGARGSTRFASLRLNVERGFSALKRDFPQLRALESREEFGKLLDLAARGGRRALETGIRRLGESRVTGAVQAPFLAG